MQAIFGKRIFKKKKSKLSYTVGKVLETSYTSLLFCYLFLISKKVVVDYNLYSLWHFTFVGGPAEEAWEPLGQGKGPGNAKAYESPHNNNKDVRVNMFVPFLFSHCPL